MAFRCKGAAACSVRTLMVYQAKRPILTRNQYLLKEVLLVLCSPPHNTCTLCCFYMFVEAAVPSFLALLQIPMASPTASPIKAPL